MSAGRTIVVALGGHALAHEGRVDIAAQFTATQAIAEDLADLAAGGQRLIITHGNAPQVGAVLRRVELAAGQVYRLPLDICVADTQGGMGFMIALCLRNALQRRGLARGVVALVTSVEVSDADPEFEAPTKPVGSYYFAEEARALMHAHGWKMVESAGRGWRRVVPSPAPLRIVEQDEVRRAVEHGDVVIAGGGGGVPVTRGDAGELRGVEAVIDKDRTAALLAGGVGAELLLIATSVPQVMLDFGKPSARPIERMNVAEARRHLSEGQFPAGSMGPKIAAAADFVAQRGGAAAAVICDVAGLAGALDGSRGTRIVSG